MEAGGTWPLAGSLAVTVALGRQGQVQAVPEIPPKMVSRPGSQNGKMDTVEPRGLRTRWTLAEVCGGALPGGCASAVP